nr:hypothetical protein BaRGS_006216 [Batillaria attramentaria]
MNRLFQIFLARNPTFSGEVSVAGHSLGSSIVFDLLANQRAVGVNFDISTLSETDTQSEASLGEADAELEQADAAEETIEEELTLEGLLEKVGLQEKMDVFHREQIDLESLSMCSEQDLKDLGLPLGPRKKLQLVLQEEKGKKEKKTARDMEKKIRRELKQKIKAEKDAAKIQRQREPSRK